MVQSRTKIHERRWLSGHGRVSPGLARGMVFLVLLLSVGAPPVSAQPPPGPCAGNTRFLVGSGIYDITGPAAELGMMGYAQLEQKTGGIHQRLRSRAFVFVSPCNGKRVAFVSADLGMISQAVKQAVTRRLRTTFGDVYSEANVLLSGTHTHSGPGGFSHYQLYNLTILGLDRQNFDAIVEGIYQSIVRAHANLREGKLTIAKGELDNVGINRSPTAHARNPEAGRLPRLPDTDKTMTLVRLLAADRSELGLINWFAVHGTSMGNDNRLISGDNKGYASYRFEREKRADYAAGTTFVAAFAQGAEGDVSPNIHGGTRGEGVDDFESARISGERQYRMAQRLYEQAREPLLGGVDFRHAYVKMDAVEVSPELTGAGVRRTCPAAIGFSMLAGAEDGPGFALNREGVTCAEVARRWPVFRCPPAVTDCQGEKPVVLRTGEPGVYPCLRSYPLTPEVLPLQILKIGSLAVIGVPHEFTTMAGRRLLASLQAELGPAGIRHTVIAGLANAYAGYVTTREEYTAQHYEGASTHFGPWTLAAYQQEFGRLASALRQGRPVSTGPTPRDLSSCQASLQTSVVFDDKPITKSFGSIVRDAHPSYRRGENVRVTFWGGHPKNDLRIQGTFLQVQRKEASRWLTVANDWDWETKYIWERNLCVPTFACSHVTVEWAIPAGARPGTYRIRHHGNWKSGLDGRIREYTGTSSEFTVN